MQKNVFLILILPFLFGFAHLQGQNQKSEYKIAQSIRLTGDGGWYYLSVDEVNQNLFVFHSSQMNVIGVKHNQQIALIPGTRECMQLPLPTI